MTTISTPSNRHVPIIPLSMPLYTYKYPNNDSIPYSELPDQFGIYNKGRFIKDHFFIYFYIHLKFIQSRISSNI